MDGEGVIGEQPTFNPGDLYQYSSCTMFDEEEYCQMEGYFLMKYLNSGELCLYWYNDKQILCMPVNWRSLLYFAKTVKALIWQYGTLSEEVGHGF